MLLLVAKYEREQVLCIEISRKNFLFIRSPQSVKVFSFECLWYDVCTYVRMYIYTSTCVHIVNFIAFDL